MLCRLAAFGRWLLRMATAALIGLGRRLLISYAVMIPIVVTGAGLWYALPELDRFGIEFSPLELRKLGKQAVIAIAGMWLVLGLSTWMRMRQNLDLVAWLRRVTGKEKDAVGENAIAASIYVTGSFVAVVWFVGTVLTS